MLFGIYRLGFVKSVVCCKMWPFSKMHNPWTGYWFESHPFCMPACYFLQHLLWNFCSCSLYTASVQNYSRAFLSSYFSPIADSILDVCTILTNFEVSTKKTLCRNYRFYYFWKMFPLQKYDYGQTTYDLSQRTWK